MLDIEIPSANLVACPLCDGSRLEPFMMFPDAARADTRIWQCLDCFAHVPEVSYADGDMRSTPGQAAFHEALWNTCTDSDMQRLRSDLRGMVDLIGSAWGEKTPENLIVEIGAGRGGLIRALIDQGYCAQGCEPAVGLVKLAREHYQLGELELRNETADVYLDRLKEAGTRPGVIVLWHVLEHLSKPLKLLDRCMDSLAPGGGLVLQLPLIDSEYVFPAHYFFITPESIPVIADRLGGLNYAWQIDYDNKYITVYLGGCASQLHRSGIPADAKSYDLQWHAARARAEPAITRDGAIRSLLAARVHREEQLRQALSNNVRLVAELADSRESENGLLALRVQSEEQLQHAISNNEQLLAELADRKESTAEALLRLEWAAQTDEANLRLISTLSDRINALEKALEDAGNTERLKEEAAQLASTVAMQAAEITQHREARQDADLRLERQIGEIESLRSFLAAREEEVATQAQTFNSLRAELDERIRIGVEKEDAIRAQALMIEQRWDAIQEMGQEIANRDRLVSENMAEIDRLSLKLHKVQKEAEFATLELKKIIQLKDAAYDKQTAELKLVQLSNEQKDDAIRAQARMIEERWDAMQQMGSVIAGRDAVIGGQSDEINLLGKQLDWHQDAIEGARSSLMAANDYIDRLGESSTIGFFRKIGLVPSAPQEKALARSRNFDDSTHNRYWWHRTGRTAYVPLVYDFLRPREWTLLESWFNDTEQKFESTGEANVPPLSLLFGLISGNGLSRIVQCGHYVGYSTLLMGFLLRRMKQRHALFSIDIDRQATAYTKSWLKRAGLTQQVQLSVSDSADSSQEDAAVSYLGGAPQLVFIDSSHQYAHTLRELDLWYGALEKGGLIVLHDTSLFAASLDKSGNGGVRRAVDEWCAENKVTVLSLNHFVEGGRAGEHPYLDGCGLSIIQKA